MSDADENAVLSQAAIDEMMSNAAGKAQPAPPQSPSPQPAPAQGQAAPADPAQPPPEAPVTAASAGGTDLADLLARVERLETTISKLTQSQTASAQLQGNVSAVTNHLKALTSRFEEVMQYLGNTLGYGARATFTCASCGARGWVASRVVCTHCNQETYVGWWPQS